MLDKKFNFETHHHDHSVRFPDTVNVHEHKAPTDDSVRLLKEMESKALDDIVLKVSEVRPNKFSYNIWFVRYACIEDFMPKGVMYITFNCNGKDYTRKVNCTSTMMQMAMSQGPEAKFHELNMQLQQYALFQTSFLISQLLFDADPKVLSDLFSKVTMSDPLKFDLSTLNEELKFWETPPTGEERL